MNKPISPTDFIDRVIKKNEKGARYHDYGKDKEKEITKLDEIIFSFIWFLLCVGTVVISVLTFEQRWERVLLINACLVLAWIVILGPSKIFQDVLSYIKKAHSHKK